MIEGLQKFQLFATGLGGITNILLNIILIPRYAGMGSAFATVISYAIASYLVYFFAPKNRKVALILTNSLFFPWRSFR
jgi:PST family polysaccharide transporter